jgi:hypothetical protein
MYIAIVGIIFGTSIPIIAIILEYRKRRALIEALHKERLAAIEKGIEVPPMQVEPDERPKRRVSGLLKGMMWFLVGIAIIVALVVHDTDAALWGLIPVAVGVAHLIYYFVEGRKLEAVEAAKMAREDSKLAVSREP